MKTLKNVLQLCVIFVVLQWSSKVEAQSFITDNGSAVFTSTAPLLEFKGTSEHLNGLINFSENLVDFYLDLNTLDTGIDLRNRHMRESYLETAKFPFAEFTGKIESNPDFSRNEPQQIVVIGSFKLHGVQKQITVQGTITPHADGTISINAEWEVLLEDYKIKRPRVVFYELSDTQTITIDTKLNPHSP
ncbi:MAG TPA: hypothetical protein DCE78_06005 [Bacteroidetes bacterium]|nr:hypothetical protein [Bacteroidota bacterium]